MNIYQYQFMQIVINAALGFDTFLVLRHGVKAESESEGGEAASSIPMGRIKGSQLGCYFCNDVVAPGNVSGTDF